MSPPLSHPGVSGSVNPTSLEDVFDYVNPFVTDTDTDTRVPFHCGPAQIKDNTSVSHICFPSRHCHIRQTEGPKTKGKTNCSEEEEQLILHSGLV